MIRGTPHLCLGDATRRGLRQLPADQHRRRFDFLRRIVDVSGARHGRAATCQGAGAGNGEDFADFLLGYGNGAGAAFGNQTSGSLVISGPISGKQTYRAFYFGDTWHATPKLTLNLGARYELQGPWSERYDKMTYFNPAVTNSSVTGCNGVAGSACPGDVFLVKTGVNSSRNNLPLSKKEFLPRLGFAYALDSKTVIRGGYGIFFIPNYVSFNANPYNDILSSATSNVLHH